MTTTPTPPSEAEQTKALLVEHGWSEVRDHTYTEHQVRAGERFYIAQVMGSRNEMFTVLEWTIPQSADGTPHGSWSFRGASLLGPHQGDPDSLGWERDSLAEAQRHFITQDAEAQRHTWREYVTVETSHRTEQGTKLYDVWEPYHPGEADDDVTDVEFTCRLRKHGDRWTSWVTLTPAPDYVCPYPRSARLPGVHAHFALALFTYADPTADISPLMRHDLGIECDLFAAEDNVAEHLEFYAFWPVGDGRWVQVPA